MARTFEPLARRLCRALYDIAAGKQSQWVSVAEAAKQINVADKSLIEGAILHAVHKGWLTVGEKQGNSLLLTTIGKKAALKKT